MSSQVTDHGNNAERFALFADGLDSIVHNYCRTVPFRQSSASYPPSVPGRPYLKVHLSYEVRQNSEQRGPCTVSNLQDGVGGNPRITVPSTIIAAMVSARSEWAIKVAARPKVPVAWIVCWLNYLRPDQSSADWVRFEVSHRCRTGICISPEHLCWESKSLNQSRGNNFCRKVCVHTSCVAMNVCTCQGFHIPPCI